MSRIPRFGRSSRRQPERAIERSCDAALGIAGWWSIPVKNRAVPIRATGWTRWHFTGLKGIPDRFCVRVRHGASSPYSLGTVIAIEYKSGSGRQSPDQIRFQKSWEAAGLRYFLVRGIVDLQKAMLDR